MFFRPRQAAKGPHTPKWLFPTQGTQSQGSVALSPLVHGPTDPHSGRGPQWAEACSSGISRAAAPRAGRKHAWGSRQVADSLLNKGAMKGYSSFHPGNSSFSATPSQTVQPNNGFPRHYCFPAPWELPHSWGNAHVPRCPLHHHLCGLGAGAGLGGSSFSCLLRVSLASCMG